MAPAIEVFCCYSHQDEPLLNELKKHVGWLRCTAPIRLDTFCVVVSSYRVDLTAPASIGFQTRLE